MNNVSLVGRLTRDPEVRDTQSGMKVAKFTLAIDRPFSKGEEKQTDFPRVVCFGKTAENVGRFISKGRQVSVVGRLQTDSYQDKDGKRIYTTDVIADRVEFLGGKNDGGNSAPVEEYPGFHAYDDDDESEIPF